MFISLVLLTPISARLADPYFTRPFDPHIPQCVLLVWPDHLETRWVDSISEVSPRPPDAPWSFLIPPERENRVKEELRNQPLPGKGAGWLLKIRHLGPNRQEIRLEIMGDGYLGLIYEATSDRIIPLRTRLAGPDGAFLILCFDLAMCGAGWLLIWSASRFFKLRAKRRSTHAE